MAPLRLISLHLLLGWIALIVHADFYDGIVSIIIYNSFFLEETIFTVDYSILGWDRESGGNLFSVEWAELEVLSLSFSSFIILLLFPYFLSEQQKTKTSAAAATKFGKTTHDQVRQPTKKNPVLTTHFTSLI